MQWLEWRKRNTCWVSLGKILLGLELWNETPSGSRFPSPSVQPKLIERASLWVDTYQLHESREVLASISSCTVEIVKLLWGLPKIVQMTKQPSAQHMHSTHIRPGQYPFFSSSFYSATEGGGEAGTCPPILIIGGDKCLWSLSQVPNTVFCVLSI